MAQSATYRLRRCARTETTNRPVERRKNVRYRLRVPVVFYWESPQHDRLQGEGVTRDISVSGAYLLTATCPPADATVQVEIIVSSVLGTVKPLIKAKMRVLRVEHDPANQGQSGFSIVGDGFALCSALRNDLKFGPAAKEDRLKH